MTGIPAQRFLFSILRVLAPVLVLGRKAIVSRHKDVMEVLGRDTEFTLAPINGPKMDSIEVPFFLGMDRGPTYEREEGAMRQVARREDLGSISDLVSAESDRLVGAVSSVGRIDVPQGLSRIVPLRLIDRYFGVRSDERTMATWTRILFWDVFLNIAGDPGVHGKALAAAKEMKPFLLANIAARQNELAKGAKGEETLLDRLLALAKTPGQEWLDTDAIRRNLSGLLVGAVETTNTAVVQALDQLLKRPDRFAEARKAAEAGDREKVRQYAYEALRFNPQAPGLLRYCEQEARLGGSVIPAGTTVVLSTLSAMFDPAAFEKPCRFDPDRKVEYLHFGAGLHQCFGRHINGVQIPGILSGLLRLKNLRRAKGSDGEIVYEGPFPDRWILEFDP
jgi:cytochrome P450